MMIPLLILGVAVCVGGILVARSRAVHALDGLEMAALIDDFVEGRRGDWEWEETWERPGSNAAIAAFKELVAAVPNEYPADAPGELCSEAGLMRLRAMRDELRQAVV